VRAGRTGGERGSAIAEFVMVSALLVVVAMGALQLAVLLHVRNVVLSSASEGARRAARADSTTAEGVARTTTMINESLRTGYADSVTAQVATVDGLRVVQVTVTAPVPVVGLFGPAGSLTVTGRSVMERQ
jgi:Flp pilus assembly protein TadG